MKSRRGRVVQSLSGGPCGISIRALRLLRILIDLTNYVSTSDTYGRCKIASQRASSHHGLHVDYAYGRNGSGRHSDSGRRDDTDDNTVTMTVTTCDTDIYAQTDEQRAATTSI